MLKQAVKHYGANAQIDKAIEEMSELTKALLKDRHGNGNHDTEVAEEIADVLIMVEQLIMIYDNEEEVDKHTNRKISRLINRFENRLGMVTRLENRFGKLREQNIPEPNPRPSKEYLKIMKL